MHLGFCKPLLHPNFPITYTYDTNYPHFSFPFHIQHWPIRSRPLPSGHVRLLKLLQTARTRETKHPYTGVHLGGTLVFWVFDGGRVFEFGWEARVGGVEVDVYVSSFFFIFMIDFGGSCKAGHE